MPRDNLQMLYDLCKRWPVNNLFMYWYTAFNFITTTLISRKCTCIHTRTRACTRGCAHKTIKQASTCVHVFGHAHRQIEDFGVKNNNRFEIGPFGYKRVEFQICKQIFWPRNLLTPSAYVYMYYSEAISSMRRVMSPVCRHAGRLTVIETRHACISVTYILNLDT